MRKRFGFLKTLGAFALGMVVVVVVVAIFALTGWLFSMLGFGWLKSNWLGMIIGSVMTLVAIAIGFPMVNLLFGKSRRRREKDDDE